MSKNKNDKELLELLTKLYEIQETVGSKPQTTTAEKRARAENGGATMGRGRKAQKAGSRFLDLKSSIVSRLKTIQNLLQGESDRQRGAFSVATGNNPKEVIARNAQMREELRQASDEWQEMDGLYKNEARKRKSKFTQEELDYQQSLVQTLYGEIEKVKTLQQKGYARGSADDVATTLNTQALNVIDMDDGTGSGPGWAGLGNGDGSLLDSNGGTQGNGVELTQEQHLQLQQINKRDQEFDQQLDNIGEGIQDLSELAQQQNEEVRRQNVMLENVGNKIDDTNQHITNVNAKMKDTLKEVRAADKLCVDVMCIVLMVGLGAILYKMIVG
mmetsp:Transcript_6747/g.7753  ORF Transcript_6747/g.7753 Transcript_6747/m.7753 type:complete len:329 (-) Transcript_6747:176-1162(-)|eukprot:CAMPEP_0204625506 /NCGR_PEP_ID=MMETSP0717-20131115/11249_1 /ASSEMBLY_ACC=CAM_ASM_000666 /TAXON_ID=230516 /ORGANISM="Chaetoceros curvisetus" /LENGTH=328 /DNA_ID=CAMNT_0051641219 /DNA_START=196 /DNA_END=1182 /DNA_ORIENTATION=+